jgi:hypothetical protein
MSIYNLEISKKLKLQFNRLGREGITKRAIELLDNYLKENPSHNYKEITKLIGRFHALYIAIDNNDYWKEIADRGFRPETYDLPRWISK